MDWIKSIRPLMAVFSFLLVLAGFRLCYGYVPSDALLPALTTAVICSSCMCWNNWRDRFHNRHLGRTLATNQPKTYFCFTISMLLVSGLLTFLLFRQEPKFILIASVMITLGLIYSETRKIVFVQNLIVSICSACPVLFPVTTGDCTTSLWTLFLGVMLMIYGREVIKDIFHCEYDLNWKNTFPVILGNTKSKLIAGALLLIAPLIIAMAINVSVGLACLCVEIFGLAVGFLARSHTWSKPVIDTGMAAFFIVFFVG